MKKGFTLIELMVIIVIIGILSALAIPRMLKPNTRHTNHEQKVEQTFCHNSNLYFKDTKTPVYKNTIDGTPVIESCEN